MPLILNRAVYFLNDFKYFLTSFLVVFVLGLILLLLKRTKFILILVASAYTLVALFALAELYFRYVYDQSDGLGFLKVNQKWHQRHVVFNNYFRRDRQFEPQKQSDEIRIAVMGDSISFGGGIENIENRFSSLLEKKLRSYGINATVYNLGVSGTGTETQVKDFSNFKHLNFDLLVWQYFLNDINPPDGGEGTGIIMANQDKFMPVKITKWLTDRSFFADWLYWRLSTKYDVTCNQLLAADLGAYQNTELISQHQQIITNFLFQAGKDKLPVIVVMFPFMFPSPLTPKADLIYDQMLTFFESRDTPVTNLKSTFNGYPASKLMASKFDSHPNELAHALAAQALYEKILAYINHP